MAERTEPLRLEADTSQLEPLIAEISSMLPAGRSVYDFVSPECLFTIGYRDNVTVRAYERVVILYPTQRLKDLAATLRANQLDCGSVK